MMPAPVPVQMRGLSFPSMAEAARAFGVSKSAIWQAIEHGREIGGKRGGARVKCYVNGKRYPSVTAAAADLGLSKAAISKRRARMARMVG